MPRTTILSCFGCRRPVGHAGKEDAAVHVNYQKIHAAEVALQQWENKSNTAPCPACSKPAIRVPGIDGRFHLDGSANQPCAGVPAPAFRLISVADLMNAPSRAQWAVHCDDCNPHSAGDGTYCNGCYWFDANRCRTWEQVASWTSHLMEKDWFQATNWGNFLQSLGPVDA
jgi:hypothetical protein